MNALSDVEEELKSVHVAAPTQLHNMAAKNAKERTQNQNLATHNTAQV